MTTNQQARQEDLYLKEESIMEQYRKLQYSQQTPQYSIQTMYYVDLPSILPSDVKKDYAQCVFLDKFTFFQMFTMLIFEYLYKDIDESKKNFMVQFKKLICQQTFLEGNFYTKGLILKGLKDLQEYSGSKSINHPIGQVLLTSDSIVAFSEFWKELLSNYCKQKGLPHIEQAQIDSSIFEIFAEYFGLNFNIHWKQKKNRFWKQTFKFKEGNQSTDTLSLVVNPDYQISVSQRSLRVGQSRNGSSKSIISSTTSSWNYIILTNPSSFKEQVSDYEQYEQYNMNKKTINEDGQMNGQEISKISEIQYSYGEADEIKILLEQEKSIYRNTQKKTPKFQSDIEKNGFSMGIMVEARRIMEIGDDLIQQMKEYCEYLTGF